MYERKEDDEHLIKNGNQFSTSLLSITNRRKEHNMPISKNNIQKAVILSKIEVETIQKQAEKEGRSFSSYVAQVLREKLKKEK